LSSLTNLQRLLHADTDRALETAFAAAEARACKPYACRAGCSACCHQLVLCTAPEASLIAHHLWSTLADKPLATRLARLDTQATAAAGLSPLGHSQARIPCAFLDQAGSCTIHAVRPMACRALMSFSSAACGLRPSSPSDLGSHRIPGSGPGLRTAKTIGVRHYRALAKEYAIDPRDFTLILPRAVAIALAAHRDQAPPDFAPARFTNGDLV
jgi:hypothetical protein